MPIPTPATPSTAAPAIAIQDQLPSVDRLASVGDAAGRGSRRDRFARGAPAGVVEAGETDAGEGVVVGLNGYWFQSRCTPAGGCRLASAGTATTSTNASTASVASRRRLAVRRPLAAATAMKEICASPRGTKREQTEGLPGNCRRSWLNSHASPPGTARARARPASGVGRRRQTPPRYRSGRANGDTGASPDDVLRARRPQSARR
jgi:hypothetical protein